MIISIRRCRYPSGIGKCWFGKISKGIPWAKARERFSLPFHLFFTSLLRCLDYAVHPIYQDPFLSGRMPQPSSFPSPLYTSSSLHTLTPSFNVPSLVFLSHHLSHPLVFLIRIGRLRFPSYRGSLQIFSDHAPYLVSS